MEETQPGQVISPGSTAQPAAPSVPPTPVLAAPAAAQVPTEIPQPVMPQAEAPSAPPQAAVTQPLAPEVPQPPYTPQEQANSVDDREVAYADRSAQFSDQDDPSQPELAWTATAGEHNPKDSTWYGAYTLGAIILSGLIYLFTRDIVSTVVVVLAVGGLVFFASREPGAQQYALDDGYLYVGPKAYSLQTFKAFSVDTHASVPSLTLWPLKRFMPPITMYCAADEEPTVTEYLAQHLPQEPHKTDAIDSLLRRIRF